MTIKVDSVPEGVQAIAVEAKRDLVSRLGLPPEAIAVTKIERLEHLETGDEASIRFGPARGARPNYRIFFLAKGIQYIYETHYGRSPVLTEEKFVV